MSYLSIKQLKKLQIKIPNNPKNILISKKASLYNTHLMEFGDNIRIDDFSILSGAIKLENFIHISAFVALYGGKSGIEIKEFCTISPKATIFASNDDFSGNALISPIIDPNFCNTKYEKVILNKHTQICTNATILPGVVCGIGSVLGAYSLLKSSISDFEIFAGIPAKKIGNRNKKILDLELEFKQHIKNTSMGGGNLKFYKQIISHKSSNNKNIGHVHDKNHKCQKNITPYKNDIKTLIKLAYSASFKDIYIKESFFDDKFNELQKYLNNKQCYLLLAKNKKEENIVGLCHFFIKNEFNQKIAHLNQIAVLEKFQGKIFSYSNGGSYDKR